MTVPTNPVDRLAHLVEKTSLEPGVIAGRCRSIYDEILRRSSTGEIHLDGANFTLVHDRDLRPIHRLYDDQFFEGCLDQTLTGRQLILRFSNRMTRAGGKTTRRTTRRNGAETTRYEIAISCHLLFQTFADVNRTVTVAGVVCHDRLQALQRILEHELVHLTEMLVWGRSSCSAPRFRGIVRRLFGHSQSAHALVTGGERALRRYHIRVGDRVSFVLDDVRYAGLVNRITKRATVLVEHRGGIPYTDGKSYRKFYVPLSLLEPWSADDEFV